LKNLHIPVEHTTLANGLRVVISPDRSAPVVTVGVYYQIGFRLEPRGRGGFAHLFEHMMFQGSENAGKMEHIRLINSSGGMLNGTTNYDITNYFESVPSNALERVLWLEADRMRALKVDDENLRNQRDVVKEEVRVNVMNQPYGGFPWLDLPPVAFRNWPNAHNFYGDFADLDAATLADVQTFFHIYYSPNNAVLLMVGDLDPAEGFALAKHAGQFVAAIQSDAPEESFDRLALLGRVGSNCGDEHGMRRAKAALLVEGPEETRVRRRRTGPMRGRLFGQIRRQSLAAAEDLEAGLSGPARLNQTAPSRGRRLHYRAAGAANQRGQPDRVGRLLPAAEDHLAATDQRQKQLKRRDVERKGRHCQQRIIGTEAGLALHRGQQIY